MESVLTEAELAEWIVFYNFEPWGTKVEDIRSANFMATFVNAIGTCRAGIVSALTGKRSRHKRAKPEDFLVNWGNEAKPKQSWQDMLKIVQALNKGMKGKDLRKDRWQSKDSTR